MKILVTGSTGFIGHHVVQWLVDNNYSVTATSTSIYKAKIYEWFDKVNFVQCDLFAENINYYEIFDKPDIIIHLAWDGLYNHESILTQANNIIQNVRLIDNILDNSDAKISVLGSYQEYGLINGCLSENIVVNPVTPYGIAKDSIRRYLEWMVSKKANHWNWIRQFHLYGDGQNPISFQGQLENAVYSNSKEFFMTFGGQKRDFIPINDAVENICKITLQNKIDGVVNCCSGIPITLKEYAENYLRAKKSKMIIKYGAIPYRNYEVMEQYGDTLKMLKCIK